MDELYAIPCIFQTCGFMNPSLWQTEWERYPEKKLYKIQPKVDDPIPSHGRCRCEETILCQLHIGHTFLTYFYLFKGEEPPVCILCDRLYSIEHLLTGCVDLIEWRRQFFKTESLSVLFRECSPNSIIQFLKCTNLLTNCDDTIVHLGFITVIAIPFFCCCHFNYIKKPISF